MNKKQLMRAFRDLNYTNPLHPESGCLSRAAKIKGTEYGVYIYRTSVIPYYSDLSRTYYGKAMEINMDDDPYYFAFKVEKSSKIMEKKRLSEINDYSDVYEFIGIENYRRDRDSVVGYSKKDNATLIFKDYVEGPYGLCVCYTISEKPAFSVIKEYETDHDYYMRCVYVYGDKVRKW